MKMSGFALIGIGVLVFVLGLFLTMGVIVSGFPFGGWFAWIPMVAGGILILVGLILAMVGK